MAFIPETINGPAIITQPMRMIDGSRMVLRLFGRLLGVGLILAAFGLWLVPGSNNGQELLLFKLILSISAGLAGVGFLQSGMPPAPPEVQIDSLRREIRVVRREGTLSGQILQSASFDDLSRVERQGAQLRFWDGRGGFLAEVTLVDAHAMEGVLNQMRAASRRI